MNHYDIPGLENGQADLNRRDGLDATPSAHREDGCTSNLGGSAANDRVDDPDVRREKLGAELERLKQEHRDLDAAISALNESGSADILQLQRLKKRKLLLKDRMGYLEDELTPDIIA